MAESTSENHRRICDALQQMGNPRLRIDRSGASAGEYAGTVPCRSGRGERAESSAGWV